MPDSTSVEAAQGAVDDARLLALRAEAEKLITETRIGARRTQRRAKLWHAARLSPGFPTAVLAGISGAAGLASAEARVPAAVPALLAAGFSAGSTFLRADARHMTNLRRRYVWREPETCARSAAPRHRPWCSCGDGDGGPSRTRWGGIAGRTAATSASARSTSTTPPGALPARLRPPGRGHHPRPQKPDTGGGPTLRTTIHAPRSGRCAPRRPPDRGVRPQPEDPYISLAPSTTVLH